MMDILREETDMAKDETATAGEGKGRPPMAALCFCLVAFALLLVPSVGLLGTATTDGDMNMRLADPPRLTMEDGSLNVNVLQDAGTWFSDHFAFRSQLVTADAALRSQVFHTSNNEQVVVGKDGWLFYGETAGSYQGRGFMSAREADNIAFNLRLMQNHALSQDRAFAFTIAPNKNSLYGQYMPDNYLAASVSNMDLLKPALQKRGVRYVDVFSALQAAQAEIDANGLDQALYLKRDTHWNALGALVAFESIEGALGRTHDDVRAIKPQLVPGEVGDLDSLLYPAGGTPEPNLDYGAYRGFLYTEGQGVTDDGIATESVDPSAQGTLYAYRDSFSNALIPYFAAAYKTAQFSKLVPYDLGAADAAGAQTVVIECAERNVADLATDPAIMEAPLANVSTAAVEETGTTIRAIADGDYLQVDGQLDAAAVDGDTDIYVRIETTGEDGDVAFGATYVPFRMTVLDDEGAVANDLGYRMRIDGERMSDRIDVSVLARVDGTLKEVAHDALSWKE